jgi:hypothetical protein
LKGTLVRVFNSHNGCEKLLNEAKGKLNERQFSERLQDAIVAGNDDVICALYNVQDMRRAEYTAAILQGLATWRFIDRIVAYLKAKMEESIQIIEAHKDAARSFGSKDCSTVEALLSRASICVENTEAEWGWVSEACTGWSMQVRKLIDLFLSRGSKPSEEEFRLLAYCHRKATEFLNRSYARLTGKRPDGTPWTKSNGQECPAFASPEGFEYVTKASCQGGDRSSMTALAGAHTPLTWNQSSLWGASEEYWNNVRLLAALNLR